MIRKNWTDLDIYNFCRQNKHTEYHKKDKKIISIPKIEVTKFTSRNNSQFIKLRDWISTNCLSQVDICQWHLGYENNIFLKFYSLEDLYRFYKFYDKLIYTRIIDVETSIKK